jgi:enoyl-CoA hydratase/carnithine racemase
VTTTTSSTAGTADGELQPLTASQAVRVTEPSSGVIRAVIDNPPINFFTPTVFAGLRLLQEYVDDPSHGVRVVIIESANPEFFIAHLDFR